MFQFELKQDFITNANDAYINAFVHFDDLKDYDTKLSGISGRVIGDHDFYGTVVLTDSGQLLCSMATETNYIINYSHVFNKTFSTDPLIILEYDLTIQAGYKYKGDYKKVEVAVTKNNLEGTPTEKDVVDFSSAFAKDITVNQKQYKYIKIDYLTSQYPNGDNVSWNYDLAILKEVDGTNICLAVYGPDVENINMEEIQQGGSYTWEVNDTDDGSFVIVAPLSD